MQLDGSWIALIAMIRAIVEAINMNPCNLDSMTHVTFFVVDSSKLSSNQAYFERSYILHRVYAFSLSQLVGLTSQRDPSIVRERKYIPNAVDEASFVLPSHLV